MKISFLKEIISLNDYQEIERLLLTSKNNPLELEDLWKIIDTVWDELGCDSNKVNECNVSEFYQHPVWLLNGLFIEEHTLSIQHRSFISDWVAQNKNINKILDYGGGFGTLARFISKRNSCMQVDIYEPFPHPYALKQVETYPNINFVTSIKGSYDCLVSTDVLEHVLDPLKLLSEMIDLVRVDGYLIIGNCFYPVIKCHLPNTFHLRYTFNQFARLMGLEVIGGCEGSHALIYQKVDNKVYNWLVVRLFESLSKLIFPILQKPQCLQAARFTKKSIDRLLKLRAA